MTPAERAEILVTARLLHAAEKLDWLATGLTLLAAAAIAFGAPNRLPAFAAVVFGIAAKWFSLRIAFDARLLEDVAAEQLTTSDLDDALGALKLAPPGKAGRPWPERRRGARRLVFLCAAATAAEGVAVVLVGVGR